MRVPIPQPGDCREYFFTYINQVDPGTDVLAALAEAGDTTAATFSGLTEEQAGYRYAPGKWTPREMAGHLTDTERVFAFRGLWVARGDVVEQPSFDENAWAAASNADRRHLSNHVRELRAVREASLLLFEGLTEADWSRTGAMSGHPVTLRAIPWIILGHERHHLRVLRERYLA